MLRRVYYFLKPALPWPLRMALRRFVAERLARRFAGSWPINPLAGRAPDGWPGWPEGKKFAFVLTHDVEGKKGVDRCRQLAEMEMRLGFRSSFNFIREGEYETPKTLREFLNANGFEVGIHDLRHDGKLYSSRQKFKANAQAINRYLAEWGAVGFRSGFMLHNLDWLRDLNILYDASTFDTDPFEAQPDGVNTIFPFWVPRDDGSGYVELPYTLPQDSTLFLLFRGSTIDTWTRKLDWVAQQGGLALLNVHPDYMNLEGKRNSSEYGAQLYQSFLEYVAQRYAQEAWFALPRDVAKYVSHHVALSTEPHVNLPSATSGASTAIDRPDRTSPVETLHAPLSIRRDPIDSKTWRLHGKRVAMVMFSYHPADPRPRRAAEALVSQGMTVDMICLREDKEPKREVLNGVDVRRVPITRHRGGIFGYVFQYSAFLLMASVIIAMRSLIWRYELVYVHNMPDVLVLSGLIPKLFGAKVVLDHHDPMPELMMTIFGVPSEAKSVRLLKLLEKWSMKIADSVVTVNRACAKIFASRSCPAQKIRVVMNSPDEEIFRFRPARAQAAAPAGSKPFVIMYHGSLVERNGPDLAVEAFARVRRSIPSAELRIYGSRNAFLERVMDSVRKQGLEGAVRYLGPRPLEQIVEAIEQCDVGIIPNQRSIFTELNTPTRIFEYLALGKPVITPRAPGICDYFDDESLLFFELGNAEDLARKIEYVFEHPAEVAAITRRGQEVYHAHTWRQERSRLTGLVAELLCDGEARDVSATAEPQRGAPSRHEEGL